MQMIGRGGSEHNPESSSSPNPYAQPYYTESIDYRTDLEAERTQNYQLQAENVKLKEETFKLRLQIQQLSSKCKDNDLLRNSVATLTQANKEIRNMLDNISEDNQNLSGVALELQQEKLSSDQLRGQFREVSLQHSGLRAKQKVMASRLKVLEDEVVRLEGELADSKAKLLTTQSAYQSLNIRYSSIGSAKDQSENHEQLSTTKDYVTVMNYYIRTVRELELSARHLTQSNKALQSEVQQLKKSARLLDETTAERDRYKKLYSDLLGLHELKCREYSKTVLEKETTAHRKLTQELDRITQFYNDAVQKKNTQIRKLLELVGLRGDLSPKDREDLGEIQKGLS